MSRTVSQHLTDEEFSHLLSGEQPEAVQEQHLAACAHCSAELENVRLSMSSFSDLSCGWAEQAAPARVLPPSRWALGFTAWPTFATGVAVTALTGLFVFHFGPSAHGRAPRNASPAISAQAAVPTKTELANDNRLMLSIDEELSYRARPGVSAADLHAASAALSPRGDAAVVD